MIDARVTAVKEDGKLDLSVRDKIPEQMDKDAEQILQEIKNHGGKLPFTDKADPEVIKEEFGMSKAAFKRAVGRLLKQKKIEILENGIRMR
ncbi:Conserved virulence factor B [Dorea longicatena]|nr:Conserved virulence factor B [Dorea longicatena]